MRSPSQSARVSLTNLPTRKRDMSMSEKTRPRGSGQIFGDGRISIIRSGQRDRVDAESPSKRLNSNCRVHDALQYWEHDVAGNSLRVLLSWSRNSKDDPRRVRPGRSVKLNDRDMTFCIQRLPKHLWERIEIGNLLDSSADRYVPFATSHVVGHDT